MKAKRNVNEFADLWLDIPKRSVYYAGGHNRHGT